jgi:NAD(P)H-dependent FMN reductase
MALRQVLELGCGALVIPQQLSVALAHEAFDDNDHLIDERNQAQLRAMVRDLIDIAQRMMG